MMQRQRNKQQTERRGLATQRMTTRKMRRQGMLRVRRARMAPKKRLPEHPCIRGFTRHRQTGPCECGQLPPPPWKKMIPNDGNLIHLRHCFSAMEVALRLHRRGFGSLVLL